MEKVILLKSLKLKPNGHIIVRLFSLMLLTFLITVAQAQTVIKGKVTDETGAGIPGANVLIKGTSAGAVTDSDGSFTISSTGVSDILVFSFIGYASQEVVIGGRTTIDIKLETDATQLGEVVVVGYGTQQKRDVTGAIASITAETLQEVAAPNVVSQLKGRLAGVDIQSNSSTPGGGGSIRIRGNRSLATDQGTIDNLDQPLLVVDGIPYGGSINDISPNDITSLEVLKDASATAIYGSRGAGGVILITTRRGKPGKTVVNYDAYYGVSSILGKLRVFNGPEYAAFKQEAANAAAAYIPAQTSGYLLTTAEQAALAGGVSTDWQDLIYQKGYVSSHTLGVTGGTDKTNYSLSGSYFKEAGIIPNQDFTRYSIRGTIDNTVSDRIKIGLNTLNTLSYGNTPGGSGVPGGLMRLTPLASPYNSDGTINLLPQAGQTDNAVVSPLTLLSKTDAILARSRVLRTFNSLYAEVKILDGLKYRVNVGLDFRQQQDDSYSGASTYVNTNPAVSATQASVRNYEAYRYTVENLIMYDKTFNEKHKIGLTGLYSFQKDHQQNTGMFGTGLPADYVQNYNMGLATAVYGINPLNTADNPNSFAERGLISYMGRANYSYDGRYVATVTVRTDGSSTLSPGNQYFTYPAFSAAWNINNEKFMQNTTSVVNTLKLRAGWGVTGNQGINPYSTLGALSTGAYNFGTTAAGQQLGYTVTTLPNSTLKWQSTSQTNIGIDFGLFGNRLTGAIEYYQQDTKDILLSVLLPPSNGAQNTIANVGKTKGHGMEISLSSINVKTASGLTWTTDLNYFFNREEIVQLTTPDEKENKANGWFVGQPITVIYDYNKIGIWQLGDATALAAQTSPVQKPGQIRVQDVNGDGKITTDDRKIIGNFQPTWEGGITNKVTFKRFDLSVQIYARMGMKVLVPYVTTDGSSSGYTFFNQSRNNQLKVDYWTPTNPTNAFPQPDATTDRAQFSSTLGYVDGSFIRCRSINLGYDFPSAWLSKVGLTSLRLYVSAVNPFIIYSPFVDQGYGPDPEGNGYGGAILPQGVATGSGQSTPTRQISVNANNPATKQFLVGLNLKF